MAKMLATDEGYLKHTFYLNFSHTHVLLHILRAPFAGLLLLQKPL